MSPPPGRLRLVQTNASSQAVYADARRIAAGALLFWCDAQNEESVRALIEAAHNLQAAALVLRTPSQQLWALELSRRVTASPPALQLA